jgi:hypothetical protein
MSNLEGKMERCENCGNSYAKVFKIIMNGASHTFDSFECAIQKLAPSCESCGTRIIGHGLEKGSQFFCCAGCARKMGVTELIDHVPLS